MISSIQHVEYRNKCHPKAGFKTKIRILSGKMSFHHSKRFHHYSIHRECHRVPIECPASFRYCQCPPLGMTILGVNFMTIIAPGTMTNVPMSDQSGNFTVSNDHHHFCSVKNLSFFSKEIGLLSY